MKMKMDVSFIIPAYNEEKMIGQCIWSIIRCCDYFKQFYMKDFKYEIIMVDNNSTDRTIEIAQALGASVIRCHEKGVTRARQAGYREAKYNFQAYIDADNELPILWLPNIVRFVDTEIVCLSGPVKYYKTGHVFENLFSDVFYKINQMFHSIFPSIQGGNFIVRKEALDKIGGHSVDILFYGEDTDLAKRLSKVGKIKLLPLMWIYSSPRRLLAEGSIKTVWIYVMNYFSVYILGKPLTNTYKDHRPE
jgi:glycosyltransferase involved in cell wall biosynthesis